MSKKLTFKLSRLYSWSSFDEDQYVLKKLSKMQARRMTKLAKITVDLGLIVSEGNQFDYVVFASRHGEVVLAHDLIHSILDKETPSPTKFSQSTHNAIAGLYSIESECHSPMTAISAGSDSFIMGLYHCANHLNLNPNHKLLFLFSDGRLPPIYKSDDNDLNTEDIALAMVIEAGEEYVLSQFMNETFAPTYNQAFSMIDYFKGETKNLKISSEHFELKSLRSP